MKRLLTRQSGTNESEKLINEVSDQCFMRLWNYPSPYRPQGKKSTLSDGKEICDHLVVFEDDILIISDKNGALTIENSEGGISDTSIEIGWKRYYKNNIQGGLKQLDGAKRWILNYPNDIYLDTKCQHKIPSTVSISSKTKFHSILILGGMEEICHQITQTPHLMIEPILFNDDHIDFSFGKSPFPKIGIFHDQNGDFVHVFTRTTFQFLLSELDTVADFISYLNEREKYLPKADISFLSEPMMVSAYMQSFNEGKHFIPATKKDWNELPYEAKNFFQSHEYQIKKIDNEENQLWDELLKHFIEIVENEEMEVPANSDQVNDFTKALKSMAILPRLQRRAFSKMVSEQYLKAKKEQEKGSSKLARLILSPDHSNDSAIVHIFRSSKNCSDNEYQKYRKYRRNELSLYAQAVFQDYPQITKFFGLSREMPLDDGCSYEIIYVERGNIDFSNDTELREIREKLTILKQNNVEFSEHTENEYPVDDYFSIEISSRK